MMPNRSEMGGPECAEGAVPRHCKRRARRASFDKNIQAWLTQKWRAPRLPAQSVPKELHFCFLAQEYETDALYRPAHEDEVPCVPPWSWIWDR